MHAPTPTGDAAPAERLAQLIEASWMTSAIACGLELGLFDALDDAARTDVELAASLACAPRTLAQLLVACEALELCTRDAEGRWLATPIGRLLRADEPGSLADWARLWTGELARLWADLPAAVRAGTSARALRGVAPGFAHLDRDPGRAIAFHRAMSANTHWVARAFATLPALEGVAHLVDVGGGHGALVAAVLAVRTAMRGTVVDLPHAAEGALSCFRTAGLQARAGFVAGDFFEAVSPRGDAYVLKSVLHDWSDARAVTILERCRAACDRGARLFVLERLAEERLQPTTSDRAWARSDLNMLVAHGAGERTVDAYAVLLNGAGFRVAVVHPLAMGVSAIEAHPC